MQRKVAFAPDEFYHLYNRGNDKRKIFLDQNDHLRFILLLYVANKKQIVHLSDLSNWQGESLTAVWSRDFGESLVDIGAYCLMPNHFHLLVREKTDNGISLFSKKLLTGYSMYFNKKHQRTGKLFEGPFRAEPVGEDRYLKYLFAYIHLNPVKITDPKNWEQKIIPDPEQAKRFLNTHRFSSYLYYAGQPRPEDVILNPAAFPEYFQDNKEFSEFVDDWTTFETTGV